MDYISIVTGLAVNTLVTIARSADDKSRFRKQLLKVFREIAVAMQSDEDFRATAKEAFK